jgi:carbamoyltransferase
MYIIGINSHHPDSSACIIKDGKLIAAVEEERFTRIKHWAGLPVLSIRHCLNEAKIKLSEVEYISVNRDPEANFFEKFKFILRQRPSYKLILDRLKFRKKYKDNKKMIMKEFEDQEFLGKMINVEHHICHLSSAFNISPFKKSCILSVDGMGDFASTVWGFANDEKISIDEKVYYPHSLGLFYESITQFLGFNNYGDEYKVMGLAPYGKPTCVNKLKNILLLNDNGSFKLNLEYYKFHKSHQEYQWSSDNVKNVYLFSNKINDLFGKPRNKNEDINQFHKDLAHSTQVLYEKAFYGLLNKIYEKHKNDNICIAGGCGNNSVANGKITKYTPFKNVYIQPASGDAGGAIGAAYYTWNNILKNKRNFVMKHSYWGNSYSNEHIKKEITKNIDKFEYEKCTIDFIDENKKQTEIVAKFIADGLVVGWFQGKMEWGPRALGNRSILADPRRSDMKNILNLKIKKRESFRPFAPSIMREHVSDWFEIDSEVPFMMKVFQIKENKRKIIPAVTHIDGSGRLQTVYEDTNYKFYQLINSFFKITNVPLILNTSFNENEPIICNPEQAINCFLRTKMDVLVMENYIIKRI